MTCSKLSYCHLNVDVLTDERNSSFYMKLFALSLRRMCRPSGRSYPAIKLQCLLLSLLYPFAQGADDNEKAMKLFKNSHAIRRPRGAVIVVVFCGHALALFST